jgi:hypothetical protein
MDVEKTATVILLCALFVKNKIRSNILHEHSNNYAQLITMTLTYLQLQKNKLKLPCIKKLIAEKINCLFTSFNISTLISTLKEEVKVKVKSVCGSFSTYA